MSSTLVNVTAAHPDTGAVTLLLKKTSPSILLLVIAVGTWVSWNLWKHVASPLKKFPGPFFARWTRLWYLYHASSGDSRLELERLHKKHGPIVRISPNVIDVDLPELISEIFGTKSNWYKTPFYHGSSALVDGKIVLNLFSQTNPVKHTKERSPIAKHYSPAGTTLLEPHMDKIISKFCEELDKRFDGQGEFDLGQWLLYYTWDVVGATTFSQPIGYLDRGCDFDGTLANADKAMDYFTAVGTMPFLDRVFDKNPYFRMGPPGFNTIAGISVQHLIDRYQGNDKDYHDPDSPDFLDKFIEAKNADPENVDDAQIISWLMVNMIAGADTTAITIRTALNFSLRNPQIWKKLVAEVRAANFEDKTPSFKDARALPYLDAVIREAQRVLPGVAMTLERFVPEGGYTLPNGEFLPAGTVVGMSPYITNRNTTIYGSDATEFRPERWLRDEEGGESEENYQKRLLIMNQSDLTFGGGRRLCIGKSLGVFQVYKVIAKLLSLYDIELSEDAYWKVTNSWFPRQEGLRTRIKRRYTIE